MGRAAERPGVRWGNEEAYKFSLLVAEVRRLKTGTPLTQTTEWRFDMLLAVAAQEQSLVPVLIFLGFTYIGIFVGLLITVVVAAVRSSGPSWVVKVVLGIPLFFASALLMFIVHTVLFFNAFEIITNMVQFAYFLSLFVWYIVFAWAFGKLPKRR